MDHIHDDDFLLDDDELLDGEEIVLEPTLNNLLEQDTLQWIFVGGKGGVGKTTMSSCLAVQLAKRRESVLIISTDPAHNLSDAFNQKFGEKPTLVEGYDNLYAMEIDPKIDGGEILGDFIGNGGGGGGEEGEGGSSSSGGGGGGGFVKGMLKDLGEAMPGMDEISSFLEIMKQVKSMKFSVVVFDTAPTGHTLRLLAFPAMLEKGFGKIMSLGNLSSLMGQFSSMFGGGSSSDKMTDQLKTTKELIDVISKQFKDPQKTTFVCVCIPEFLSVYETERLVQELTKNEIDSHNVIVNQLVFQDEDCECKMCKSRMKIQQKYLAQVFELYEHFHVVQMPLLGEEVRGAQALDNFGKYLLEPHPQVYKREDLLNKQQQHQQ